VDMVKGSRQDVVQEFLNKFRMLLEAVAKSNPTPCCFMPLGSPNLKDVDCRISFLMVGAQYTVRPQRKKKWANKAGCESSHPIVAGSRDRSLGFLLLRRRGVTILASGDGRRGKLLFLGCNLRLCTIVQAMRSVLHLASQCKLCVLRTTTCNFFPSSNTAT
jgi:hypothetical protein